MHTVWYSWGYHCVPLRPKKEVSVPFDSTSYLCEDLGSTAIPGLGKILVTGATGYIGGLLVPELQHRGYDVRLLVRRMSPEHRKRWPGAEIMEGDSLDLDSLGRAFRGIHTAYYLIHSLLLGRNRFQEAEVRAAENFRIAAEEAGLKRIVYLGGLGDAQTDLSRHLRSRMVVAETLRDGEVPVTILRAAIIIGSGSASFELIKNLVEKLLILLMPYWARTECQPISIREVIMYLVGVLEKPETTGKSYDIGGKDVMTYESMMREYAEVLGIRRLFLRSPVSSIGLFAYLANLLTPVHASIVRMLLGGIKNRVVCQNNDILEILPIEPVPFKTAVFRAIARREQDGVHTRWTDAYPPAHYLATRLHELDPPPEYTSTYGLTTEKEAHLVFASICRIGGAEGWFRNNWMWRARGVVDSILMGVGPSRGRRNALSLRVNDVIDFWRVEDIEEDERLLLRAEMKLPGKAWLEYRITDMGTRNRLAVTAHFRADGTLGKMYWSVFLPFHRIIFKDLIQQIEQRS